MKKLVVLSVLGATCVAASAESSLNLFGAVDIGVRHEKTGAETLTDLSAHGLGSSKLGVQGVEDLGQGLKVGFWLESGFKLNTGEAHTSRFWGRRSTLSLSGGFGEFRFGRDALPTADWGDFDVFGGEGVGHTGKFETALGSNRASHSRANNLVSYFTPEAAEGFYAQVSAAPSGGQSGNKYAGARVGYKTANLNVSTSYGQTWVNPFPGDGTSLFKVSSIGTSYDFKVMKLAGYVGMTSYGPLRQLNYQLGAEFPVGKNAFRVAVVRTTSAGKDAAGVDTRGDGADQLAVGYVYNLSKRTSLYADAATVRNRGNAKYAIGGLPASDTSIAGGFRSTGYEMGLMHTF